MPRSLTEIIANANDLADRFERHDPDLGAVTDASALREVARSAARRAAADAAVLDAVTAARAEGHSWAAIGAMLGTSGEAARQRYASALSQTKSSGVTGKKAGASAGKTLGAKRATKAAKSAAGSALTQRSAKKAATRKK